MIVRSPDVARWRSALEADGATVTDADGALEVSGLPIERVGELAARDGVILHELRTRAHTLEQAFLPSPSRRATPALRLGSPSRLRGGAWRDPVVRAELLKLRTTRLWMVLLVVRAWRWWA